MVESATASDFYTPKSYWLRQCPRMTAHQLMQRLTICVWAKENDHKWDSWMRYGYDSGIEYLDVLCEYGGNIPVAVNPADFYKFITEYDLGYYGFTF